jgi:hypothetical protein
VWGQRHAPAALYPRERPGTHCTGGWVGPRTGLDGGIQVALTLMQRKEVPVLAMEVYGGIGVNSSQPYVYSTLK